MDERITITLSIPDDFLEKFIGFLNNVNMINNDLSPPIVIEKIMKINKDDFVAVPKEPK